MFLSVANEDVGFRAKLGGETIEFEEETAAIHFPRLVGYGSIGRHRDRLRDSVDYDSRRIFAQCKATNNAPPYRIFPIDNR